MPTVGKAVIILKTGNTFLNFIYQFSFRLTKKKITVKLFQIHFRPNS